MSGVSAEEGLSSVESLKGFVQTLVPLLLECWVEASPADQAASSPGNLVESEAMLLMHQVLWIIQLLRTLVQLHDHSRNMASSLLRFLYLFRNWLKFLFLVSVLPSVVWFSLVVFNLIY